MVVKLEALEANFQLWLTLNSFRSTMRNYVLKIFFSVHTNFKEKYKMQSQSMALN